MTVRDAAEHIISKLVPEEIAYAGSKERGQYRGFAALHDHCDANMLIPGAEDYDAGNEAQTAWMNAVMDEVTAIIVTAFGD